MEDLTLYHTKLKKLRDQATRLTSDVVSLAKLFAEEASRLNRMDAASRLIALRSFISQEIDRARSKEAAASNGYSQANLITSLGSLAAGSLIRMVSKNSAFSDHLFNNLPDKQPPFGNVLVCIGPKGIPDDAKVVSISRLARESNREESQVVNELNERGYFLLPEDAFSLLMDKLINHVREGQVLLPVSLKKLLEIRTLGTG